MHQGSDKSADKPNFERRQFVLQSSAIAVASFLPINVFAQSSDSTAMGSTYPSGAWIYSKSGLPAYKYTGALPFRAVDTKGNDAKLPDDPYFILGNYRCTLFAHVSGILQFMTGERVWTRINAATDRINYGDNAATLSVKGKNLQKNYSLIGINSVASDSAAVQRTFGPGFARYEYHLDEQVECKRVLSVKPSEQVHEGNPAVVVSVTLQNTSSEELSLSYKEKFFINYMPMNLQELPKKKQAVRYVPNLTTDDSQQTAYCKFEYAENVFLPVVSEHEHYLHDKKPVSVFMQSSQPHVKVGTESSDKKALVAQATVSLKPRESKTFHIVIGLTYDDQLPAIQLQTKDLFKEADTQMVDGGLFAKQWKSKLPDLSAESDDIFKKEMLWNAYVLEAMATYNSYFKETFIPQGTIYTYEDGENISNRDHSQALLPVCYTNPALAKSSLRYVMKHSASDGEIGRGNGGFGYIQPSIYKESDAQLYLFLAISEYLRITRDYALLQEKVAYYPLESSKEETVANLLKKYFVYLRDEVNVGAHGLIRILNSDWSDSFFHVYSPNIYAGEAESVLNTTMALAVFPNLISVLEASGDRSLLPFIKAMKDYQNQLSAAFLEDFGDRNFAARTYLNARKAEKFGMDMVCIEPQGYLLQMPQFATQRKQAIYRKVKAATYTPEKIGFRTREKPMWPGGGEGEDGGIWYSLEGPVIIGVSTFDKQEAWALLRGMSFHHFATQYPDYWVGQWTGPDNINSTLSPRQGLYSYWQDTKAAIQGFCSHPHSWPLYCYFKLKEQASTVS